MEVSRKGPDWAGLKGLYSLEPVCIICTVIHQNQCSPITLPLLPESRRYASSAQQQDDVTSMPATEFMSRTRTPSDETPVRRVLQNCDPIRTLVEMCHWLEWPTTSSDESWKWTLTFNKTRTEPGPAPIDPSGPAVWGVSVSPRTSSDRTPTEKSVMWQSRNWRQDGTAQCDVGERCFYIMYINQMKKVQVRVGYVKWRAAGSFFGRRTLDKPTLSPAAEGLSKPSNPHLHAPLALTLSNKSKSSLNTSVCSRFS